jgi:DnaJ-domain-containing protein 1
MSVWSKIADRARDRLTDLKDRTFGKSRKPLGELSDRELEEELVRRRRERSQRRGGGEVGSEPLPPEQKRSATASPQEQQLAQYYANLELPYGASLEDVRKSYREMMRRYHPDKHAGNPERHKAATELAQSLTNAYRALVDHLSKR